MFRKLIPAALVATLLGSVAAVAESAYDPFLWLEEVEGPDALAWVEEHNERSTAHLEAVPEFADLHEQLLAILDSSDRIPSPSIQGEWVYNFWQDAEHVRGIWRRTTLDDYKRAEPSWETVLDVDDLGAAEGESWVWKGATCQAPEYRRCLVRLSRGGGDAVVVRELDTVAKAFVEGGFVLAEAKSSVSWKDADTLWVGTDLGEGSLTTSGYPRFSVLWRRGTLLEEAPRVFEGAVDSVGAGISTTYTAEGSYDLGRRIPAFFRGEHYLRLDGRMVRLDLPLDIRFYDLFADRVIASPRTPWQVGEHSYPPGSLLAVPLDTLLEGRPRVEVLWEPSDGVALDEVERTRNLLLVAVLDQVKSRLYELRLVDGLWRRSEVELPGLGSLRIGSTSDTTDDYFFTYEDFLTPDTLYLAGGDRQPEAVKQLPAYFPTEGLVAKQRWATSADGTRVPYFLVRRSDAPTDGSTPTLLYGYGGFEVSLNPSYSAERGAAWLSRGGALAVANIRGGGELGPGWHQAALKANRHKAYEDFEAVAEDLIAQGVTSPQHLGIMGGSNGGLLVGAAFTRRPELYGAVVCQVPLLDMKRYSRLLAGASWMAEYGDPDVPEEWEFIRTFSPYHNLHADQPYPRVFFRTSTRDDRVHPGHARKMVAKMESMGYEVVYWENTEGGHAGAADNRQRAYGSALDYAYLWSQLHEERTFRARDREAPVGAASGG